MISNRQRTQKRVVRARRGVSLVELLVAMTLLTMGLLAIVGVSASVTRSLGESRTDNTAALVAQSRFEQLAGTACTSLTLNTTAQVTTRGVTERYRVLDGGNNTRQIIDSVSWTTRKGTRRQAFSTLLPCRPGA
ncbi:MAG: type IV pilus modification PilV family protein [Burkholderiales bacterium]